MYRISLIGSCILVIAVAIFLWESFEYTKHTVDKFANSATILGLIVSIVGFFVTIASILQSVKVSKETQAEVQNKLEQYRNDSRRLLTQIRYTIICDACDQAISHLEVCKLASKAKDWHRTLERIEETRKLIFRILPHNDITGRERSSLVALGQDFRHTINLLLTIIDPPSKSKQNQPPTNFSIFADGIDLLAEIKNRLQLHPLTGDT